MSDYCIVADVTMDLPKEWIEKLGIIVIPMEFILGEQTYTHFADERELSCDRFYEELKQGKESVTSQITPFQYQEIYEPILKTGKDIVSISLSSGLSGTYLASLMVAENMKKKYKDQTVYCVDSRCASIGEGLLVYLAAMQKQKGKTAKELYDYLEEYKFKCCHWFTVEDLHHLKRGGRLSSLEAVVGTALKIHPVLSTDREGKLRVVYKVRGARKALDYLLKRFESDSTQETGNMVIVAHSDCPDYAEYLVSELEKTGKAEQIMVSRVGPVIGTHTGSGMCALVFVGNNDQ